MFEREQGFPEKYVLFVKDMYGVARIQDKTIVGVRGNITFGVGLHQGSSISPCLSVIILDVMECGIKEKPTRCMLFVDSIVL